MSRDRSRLGWAMGLSLGLHALALTLSVTWEALPAVGREAPLQVAGPVEAERVRGPGQGEVDASIGDVILGLPKPDARGGPQGRTMRVYLLKRGEREGSVALRASPAVRLVASAVPRGEAGEARRAAQLSRSLEPAVLAALLVASVRGAPGEPAEPQEARLARPAQEGSVAAQEARLARPAQEDSVAAQEARLARPAQEGSVAAQEARLARPAQEDSAAATGETELAGRIELGDLRVRVRPKGQTPAELPREARAAVEPAAAVLPRDARVAMEPAPAVLPREARAAVEPAAAVLPREARVAQGPAPASAGASDPRAPGGSSPPSPVSGTWAAVDPGAGELLSGPPNPLVWGEGVGEAGPAPAMSGDGDVRILVQRRVNAVARLLSPSLVKRCGRGGTARIRVACDEHGYVRELVVLESTGARTLDAELPSTLHFAEPFPAWRGWLELSVSYD